MRDLYFPGKARFLEKLRGFVCLFWWNGYGPHSTPMDPAVNIILLEKFIDAVAHVLGIGIPALLRCETADYFVFNLGRHSIHSSAV